MDGHIIAFRAAMTRKGAMETRKDHIRREPVRFVPIHAEQIKK